MASIPSPKHVDKVMARFKALVAKIEDSSDLDEAWQDEALLLGARLVNYSALCYKQYQSAVLALRRIESDAYGNNSDCFEDFNIFSEGSDRICPSYSFQWLYTHRYGMFEESLEESMSTLCFVVSKAKRDAKKRKPSLGDRIKQWVFRQPSLETKSFLEFKESSEHDDLYTKLARHLKTTKNVNWEETKKKNCEDDEDDNEDKDEKNE